MKFGTKLHMEVHNELILDRICRCCEDKDIEESRWCPAAIMNNNSFIHKIFIFDRTKVIFGVDLPFYHNPLLYSS